jgi:hypothetical protein
MSTVPVAPPLCNYITVNDSSPGSQVWDLAAGAFVGLGDATFVAWLSQLAGAPNGAPWYPFNLLISSASSSDAGATTTLAVDNTSILTTGAKYNFSATGGLYDGNFTITVVDGTHVKIATAFAGNTTGQMSGAAIVATAALLNNALRSSGLSLIPTTGGFYSSQSLTIDADTVLTNTLPEFTFITNTDVVSHKITLAPANQLNSIPVGFPFYIFNLATSAAAISIFKNDGVQIGTGSFLYPGDKILLCLLTNSSAAGTYSFARLPAFVTVGLFPNDATIPVGQTSAATPAFATWVVPSGDLTMSDLGTFTLASTIAAGGPTGDASHVAQITYDAKGRLTTVTSIAIAISDSAITYGNESAHTVFAGPTSGAAAPPGFRALVAADIPQLPFTDLTGTIASGQVSGSYTGITGVGALTAGTWNGVKIGLAYGGTNADLSATGGAHQFLKQSIVGAPVTVGQPASTDLSDLPIPVSSGGTGAAKYNACRIYLSASQTGMTSGTWAKINLDTKEFDPDTIADVATNHRITPNVAGIFLVSVAVLLDAATSFTGEQGVAIAKNGTRVRFALLNVPVGIAEAGVFTLTDIVQMNGTTDFIELQAFGSTVSSTWQATASQLTTWLSCVRVGP